MVRSKPSESEYFESEPPLGLDGAKPAATITGRRSGGFFSDPVVRTMGWIALVLVALYVTTIVSGMALGIVGGKPQYRTAAERQVGMAAAAYKTAPTDDAVAGYVTALIGAGRFDTAQSVIDSSIASVDESATGSVTAAKAQLEFAQKEYESAIKTAEESKALSSSHYEQVVAGGGKKAAAARLPESYWSMVLLQARSSEENGDLENALAYYDTYLADRPTAADVLVARGNLKIELDDSSGAETDFRSALRFVPDDASALAGLEKIGAE